MSLKKYRMFFHSKINFHDESLLSFKIRLPQIPSQAFWNNRPSQTSLFVLYKVTHVGFWNKCEELCIHGEHDAYGGHGAYPCPWGRVWPFGRGPGKKNKNKGYSYGYIWSAYLVSGKHASKGIHFALLTTNSPERSKQFFNIKGKRAELATQAAAPLRSSRHFDFGASGGRVALSGKQWSRKGVDFCDSFFVSAGGFSRKANYAWKRYSNFLFTLWLKITKKQF